MGASSDVTFDSKGHLYVLSRGTKPLTEFDENGKFIRAFGDGLFTRSHGIRIDKDGNIWTTDVGAHTVMKLSHDGEVLLTLGTKGKAGEWNEAAGTQLFNEPNDIAIAANGDLFITQGHTPGAGKGDPRVLKFDKNGKFIKTWGGKGTEPGKFDVAHGIAIDAKGLLWVTDRENQRIQIFDQDGKYIREVKYAGLPCSLDIGKRTSIWSMDSRGSFSRWIWTGKFWPRSESLGRRVPGVNSAKPTLSRLAPRAKSTSPIRSIAPCRSL